MSNIWYESLYYSGSKSRQYKCPTTWNNITQEDKRLFAYLWKNDPKHPNSKSKETYNGIAREYGERVYRENIH